MSALLVALWGLEARDVSAVSEKITRFDEGIIEAVAEAHAINREGGGVFLVTALTLTALAQVLLGVGAFLLLRQRGRREDERNRALLEANPDIMFLIGDDGCFLDYRGPETGPLPFHPEEMMGQSISQVLPAAEAERLQTALRELPSSGAVSLPYVYSRDGHTRHFDARITRYGQSGALVLAREITERALAEEQARAAQFVIDHAGEAIFFVSTDASFEYVNDSACVLLGYDRQTLLTLRVHDIDIRANPEGWVAFRQQVKDEGPLFVETVFRTGAGAERSVEISVAFAVVGERELLFAFCRDVSARKEAEAQLLQAQKLEAVGRLAGGVAHDFNNLLTVILAFAGFALEKVAPGSEAAEDLETVIEGGEKAAALVSQLLAFSRRRAVAPREIDIDSLVEHTVHMLRRVLGEDVVLTMHLGLEGWSTRMDPTSFDQVLMNLAVNARDAMPGGGEMIIRTTRARLEPSGEERESLEPGDYLMLSISDSGTGMDEETRRRCFEPFFSTKPERKGTGLGLASCMGLVVQAGGRIDVESAVGEGTTFTLLLPRYASAPLPVAAAPTQPARVSGAETILVVDDREGIRDLAARTLTRLGYEVVVAEDGLAALELAMPDRRHIDLIVTDVVMPRMGGPELVDALAPRYPGVPVIFMSGFTDHPATQQTSASGHRFLAKPFSPNDLAEMVREALDD